MADPIHDRHALTAALRPIEREAESYLEGVDAALVRPPVQPPIEGDRPTDDVGSLAALAELVVISNEGATRSTGPRFFSLCDGRSHARRAGRRLAHVDAQPERLQLGQLAVRIARRAGHAGMAQGLVRYSDHMECCDDVGRDDRELGRPGGGAALVGLAAWRRRGRRGLFGVAAGAGIRRRLPARERDQGAWPAGHGARAAAHPLAR